MPPPSTRGAPSGPFGRLFLALPRLVGWQASVFGGKRPSPSPSLLSAPPFPPFPPFQVYSAEEKAALAMINYEEKAKREVQVMADLKRLVDRSLGPAPGEGAAAAPDDEEGA